MLDLRLIFGIKIYVLVVLICIISLSSCANSKQLFLTDFAPTEVRLHIYHGSSGENDNYGRCVTDKCLKEPDKINVEKYTNLISGNLDFDIKVFNRSSYKAHFPNKVDRTINPLKDVVNLHACFKNNIKSEAGRIKLETNERWERSLMPTIDVFAYVFGDKMYGDNEKVGTILKKSRNATMTFLPSETYTDYMTDTENPDNIERIILHEFGHALNLNEMWKMQIGDYCEGECISASRRYSLMNQLGNRGISTTSPTCLEYSQSSIDFLNKTVISDPPMFGKKFNKHKIEKFCRTEIISNYAQDSESVRLTSVEEIVTNDKIIGTYRYDKTEDSYEKFQQVYLDVELSLADGIEYYNKDQSGYDDQHLLVANVAVSLPGCNDCDMEFDVISQEYHIEDNMLRFRLPVASATLPVNQDLESSQEKRKWIIIEDGSIYKVSINSVTFDGQITVPDPDQKVVDVPVAANLFPSPLDRFQNELSYLVEGLRYDEFNNSTAKPIISALTSNIVSEKLRNHYFSEIAKALENYQTNICILSFEEAKKGLLDDSNYANTLPKPMRE